MADITISASRYDLKLNILKKYRLPKYKKSDLADEVVANNNNNIKLISIYLF